MPLVKTVTDPGTRQIVGDFHLFKSVKYEKCVIPTEEEPNKTVLHYWLFVDTYVSEFDWRDGAEKVRQRVYQIDKDYHTEGYSFRELEEALAEQVPDFLGAEIISE